MGWVRVVSKKVDPKNHDYNNDTYITESDFDIGKKDLNKDGKVTSEEEAKYDKRQTTTTTTTTTKGDQTTSSTKTPPDEERGPKWTRAQQSAAGFTKEFLKRHPAVAKILKDAIEFDYTEEEFMDRVIKDTKWGQTTFDAQRQFDLLYYGSDSTGIKNTIERNKKMITKLAENAGVALDPEDLDDFSFRYTRSALTDDDIYDFISRKYGASRPTEPDAEVVLQGDASSITDEIKALARSYGVTLTPETLDKKVQEALSKGPEWRSWVEGQRNVFRQSAKSMYPSAGDKLDEYTLEELVDPYLEDAANLLGVNRVNMDLSNPMWTRALSGESGAPMSREEWLRTLRTDKQYGWGNTQRAKSEMASLGDELLAAFGMA